MTKEQLIKSNEISKVIEKLEAQKQFWQNSNKFRNSELAIAGTAGWNVVDTDYIEFEIMKTLTLSAIQKFLDRFNEEFKNI